MSTALRYLEDFEVGERWEAPPVTITQDDITTFGRMYDPQPMHTDPARAANGPFGGLIASGWHMAALAMRLLVEGRSYGGTPIVGVGVDELRWLQPVRPGDVLTLERTIAELLPPAKAGGRGTIKSRVQMRNQRGEVALQMFAIGKVPSRPASPATIPADAPLRRSDVEFVHGSDGAISIQWKSEQGRLEAGEPAVDAPMNRRVANVVDWMPVWATRKPDALFMAERDAQGHWQRLSWSEAWHKVQAIASTLLQQQQELGTKRLVVAVLSGNSVRQALLTFAGLYAGVVIAPVSPGYVSAKENARLKAVLDVLEPQLAYCEQPQAAMAALHSIGAGHVECIGASVLDAWARNVPQLKRVHAAHAAAHGEATAKVMFTSGSTGVPKGVVMSHAMLSAAQATSAANLLHVPENATYLEWLPWHHVMGGNVNLHRILRFGGSAWLDGGKPVRGKMDETLANLREVAPSFYFNVPLGYAMLIPALEQDASLARHFFSRLEYVSYGGAVLDPQWVERFDALALAHAGRRVAFTSAYGATETCGPGVTTGPGMPSSGALGLPSPGVTAKLVPLDGRFELRLRGENIRANYLGRPELSAAAHDEEGFYITGDAVSWVDPEQPHKGLAFSGRVSEDFKLASGTWVNVGALRAKLLAALAPLATEAAITGHDREHIGALLFVDEKLRRGAALRGQLEDKLATFNAAAGGSSHRVQRISVLAQAPDADRFEITDKGYLNQRAVLQNHAAQVERLYSGAGPAVLIPNPHQETT